MITLTVICTCLLDLVLTAIVSSIRAFPVAGILYGLLTILLGVVSLPFWSWYAISAGALFIFKLLFKSNENETKK